MVRRAASFGTPEDVAGLIVYLASDASAAVTGQAIGIGGDRLSLWSHPTEIRSAFMDGGWSADAIAEAFESTVAEVPETYGIPAPKLPELQPQDAVTGVAEPYVPGLDVGALTAIDVHTHAETDGCGHYSLPEELRAGADKYFGVDGGGPPTLDQLAAYYRERNMAAVVFTVDAEAAARAHPDRQRGGHRGRPPQHRRAAPLRQHRPGQGQGRRHARRGGWSRSSACAASSSTRASRPSTPNDPSVYPLYEVLEELGVPGALPQRPDRHRLGAAAAAAGSG